MWPGLVMQTAVASTPSAIWPRSGTARGLSSRGLQGDGDPWTRGDHNIWSSLNFYNYHWPDTFIGMPTFLVRISTVGVSGTVRVWWRVAPSTLRAGRGPPPTPGRESGAAMWVWVWSAATSPDQPSGEWSEAVLGAGLPWCVIGGTHKTWMKCSEWESEKGRWTWWRIWKICINLWMEAFISIHDSTYCKNCSCFIQCANYKSYSFRSKVNAKVNLKYFGI